MAHRGRRARRGRSSCTCRPGPRTRCRRCCDAAPRHAFVSRVPGLDAVVEAPPYLRPQAAQPLGVAADAPLAVHLHDPAELAVGRGVEVVLDLPDGQRAPECLVPGLVLRRSELGLPQGALEIGEEMGHGLGVVPDVRARAAATAGVVGAAFPGPKPPVGLSKHGGRLEDRQVRGHRFDHLGRQRGVVEAVAESSGLRRKVS